MNTSKRVETPSGLIMDFSPVLAEKIITPEMSKLNGVVTDRHRVQLRQEVKTTYPKARGNALFDADEFGKGPGDTYTEVRVTWLNVPKDATLETITKRLEEMEQPKLVRTLSLKPVLSEEQIRTIENGRNPKSYEDYRNDFVVDGNGQPALFHGQKQYRRIDFSRSFVEDEDLRGVDYQELSATASFQIAAVKTTEKAATAKI